VANFLSKPRLQIWSGDRASSLFDLTTWYALYFPPPVGPRLTGIICTVAFLDPSIISLSRANHTLAAVARRVYFDFRSSTTGIIRYDCRATIYNNKSSLRFAFTAHAILYYIRHITCKTERVLLTYAPWDLSTVQVAVSRRKV